MTAAGGIIALPALADTARLAAWLAAGVRPGDQLWLDGELGAGKTALVRELVAALGGDAGRVTSPTYDLVHEYAARIPVLHVDAWRLERPGDFTGLGLDERADDKLMTVEWASRVAPALDPASAWRVSIAFDGHGTRLATVCCPENRHAAPLPGAS